MARRKLPAAFKENMARIKAGKKPVRKSKAKSSTGSTRTRSRSKKK